LIWRKRFVRKCVDALVNACRVSSSDVFEQSPPRFLVVVDCFRRSYSPSHRRCLNKHERNTKKRNKGIWETTNKKKKERNDCTRCERVVATADGYLNKYVYFSSRFLTRLAASRSIARPPLGEFFSYNGNETGHDDSQVRDRSRARHDAHAVWIRSVGMFVSAGWKRARARAKRRSLDARG